MAGSLCEVVDQGPADPELIDTVRAILAERGVASMDQLADALDTAGVELGSDPVGTLDAALDSDAFGLAVPLADGRWVWMPTLLTGRVFTHRLTARELAHDLLDVTPDLAPVMTLTDTDPFTHLADGTPVTEVFTGLDADVLADRSIPADAVDADGGLLLPPGYLHRLAVSAGDLVGVRVTPTGLAARP